MGDAVSDREIARLWGMEWRSFLALKQGKRQVPRIDQLERLAELLHVDPVLVYQAASGSPAEETAALIQHQSELRDLLDRVGNAGGQNRQLLQTFFDHIPAACILFEADGTISAANPLVDSVCESTPAELIGRNAIEVFGNPGPIGCPVTRAFLTGRVEQQVSWMKNRKGERVYVHRTAGPIRESDKVARVIEIMVDVTDQIRRGDLRVLSFWRGQADESAGAKAAAERRVWPRAPVSFTAELRYGRSTKQAQVHNLAAGGLFLVTDATIPIGSRVELGWTLPGDRIPVRARGVVVWSQPMGARSSGLGVRFTDLEPEAKAS